MHYQRVFIAINLPGQIKENLVSYQLKYPELPCRWVKKDNLHITLVFLGHLNDQEILEVCRVVKEVSKRHIPFSLNFTKVGYGPTKEKPRLLWVEGGGSEKLGLLQNDLHSELLGISSDLNKASGHNRKYVPHITLGRVKQFEFRRINLEDIPQVEEYISLTFVVSSIEIMASRFRKGGPEYTILESYILGDE